jgi:hypothetical protein
MAIYSGSKNVGKSAKMTRSIYGPTLKCLSGLSGVGNDEAQHTVPQFKI